MGLTGSPWAVLANRLAQRSTYDLTVLDASTSHWNLMIHKSWAAGVVLLSSGIIEKKCNDPKTAPSPAPWPPGHFARVPGAEGGENETFATTGEHNQRRKQQK